MVGCSTASTSRKVYRGNNYLSSSGRSVQTSARALMEGYARKSRYWTRFYDVLSLAFLLWRRNQKKSGLGLSARSVDGKRLVSSTDGRLAQKAAICVGNMGESEFLVLSATSRTRFMTTDLPRLCRGRSSYQRSKKSLSYRQTLPRVVCEAQKAKLMTHLREARANS